MYIRLLKDEFKELRSITNFRVYHVNYFYTDEYRLKVMKYLNIFHYNNLAITYKNYQIRCRYNDYVSEISTNDFFYELTNFVNYIFEGKLASLYEALYNTNIIESSGLYDNVFSNLKTALENSIPVNLIVKYLNTSLLYAHSINNIHNNGTAELHTQYRRSLLIDQIRCYEIAKHLYKKTEQPLINTNLISIAQAIDRGEHDDILAYISVEYRNTTKDLYKHITLNHKHGKVDYNIGFDDYKKLNNALQDVYIDNKQNNLERFDLLLWNLYRFESSNSYESIKKLRKNFYDRHTENPSG